MRKAQRRKAKARVGISGPAGSGKSYSSLLIAYGICGDWEKVCLVDTESGSGDLYANHSKDGITIGEYNIIPIDPPYTPEKYMAAIRECEEAGMEVVIIDSLTHAWAGEGGLLDKKGQIEKKTGNGWTAWRDVTPIHNQLVESILHSKCHIISTLRAKMDYVQDKDSNGRTTIRKIGMNPIQRDGMEYEFTVFLDIDQDHHATTSKDRTSILDGLTFRPGIDTGRKLQAWLESGAEVPEPQRQAEPQPEPQQHTPPQTQQTQPARSTAPKASEAQLRRIQAESHSKGIDYHPMLTQFGITSSKELTVQQASAVIDALNKLPSTAAGR
jgi:hypothetical protein